MAHFAELDENNIVLRVIVVDNSVLELSGVEHEQRGIDHLEAILPDAVKWVQTSYNNNLRGKYASRGDVYHSSANKFASPDAPYPSWTFNSDTAVWEPPVAKVHDDYEWDEDSEAWVRPGQPHESWTWEETDATDGRWMAPVEYPGELDGTPPTYTWDEEEASWIEDVE